MMERSMDVGEGKEKEKEGMMECVGERVEEEEDGRLIFPNPPLLQYTQLSMEIFQTPISLFVEMWKIRREDKVGKTKRYGKNNKKNPNEGTMLMGTDAV
jgi:hypothetical protein